MKTFIPAALLFVCFQIVRGGASEQFHARHGNAAANAVMRHRRHHVRAEAPTPLAVRYSKRGKKCKVKSSGTASGTASAATSTSSTVSKHKSSNSTASSSSHCPSAGISVNGVCVGMLPDGGSDGSSQDTMATLNNLVTSTGKKHAYFGQYAQVSSNSWDGSQLTQVMDDLKSSGAIFQPAVMPTGLQLSQFASDSSLPQQVCTVMKQFTDEGIEVWLRFAHECNWYITDGTYQGSLSDCKNAFVAVAQACKTIAPEVKMFWTPNVGDLGTYEQMWPGTENVDYMGIDYYPNSGSDLSSTFVQVMQPLHDQYTSSNGPYFAIGETGLGYAGSQDEKVQFLKSMFTAATSDMPNLKATSWFNYQKGYDFKILDPNDQSTVSSYVSAVSG